MMAFERGEKLMKEIAYMRECFERELSDGAGCEDSGLSPEEVQELAKAKAEGRLMIMPCKPGDIVFVRSGCLFYKDNAPYTKCEVVNFRKGKKGNVRMYLRPLTESACGTNYHVIYSVSCIGLTVFLTKEAAEKALGVVE